MIDKFDKVKKFHEVFSIGNEKKPKAVIDRTTFLLRHRLMQEENEEYLEACENGDMVEIADALGDMLYIWCGTVLKHGMQDIICDIFDEIQNIGITASASSPEILVSKLLNNLKNSFDLKINEAHYQKEDTYFKVPQILKV